MGFKKNRSWLIKNGTKERTIVDTESDVSAAHKSMQWLSQQAVGGGGLFKERHGWIWDMYLETEPAGFASQSKVEIKDIKGNTSDFSVSS